jgi:integrase
MLRYRLNTADGLRKENTLPIGLLRDFPTEKAAWKEVDRLGLLVRINSEESETRIRFNALAEYYLKADFGEDAVRPKSVNTVPIVEHYVRYYLIARWGNELASDIRPLEIQRWLKALHIENGLAWTTVSKIRGIMHRIYKIGVLHERVDKNPVEHVETRSQSFYKAIVITPKQTLAILNLLSNPLHFTLVLTCAATALRASEIVSLRWSDILWSDRQIRISKRWA